MKLRVIISKNMNPKSHPTMGAWIEIQMIKNSHHTFAVAPHDGCVD